MRKLRSLVLALFLPAIAGCSSTSQQPDGHDAIRVLAEECVGWVQAQASGQPGTVTLTSRQLEDVQSLQVGGIHPGSDTQRASRGLPAVEATALDAGRPGSAWRACLGRRMAERR